MPRIHVNAQVFESASGLGFGGSHFPDLNRVTNRGTTATPAFMAPVMDSSTRTRVGTVEAHSHPAGAGAPIMGAMNFSPLGSANHLSVPVHEQLNSPALMQQRRALEQAAGAAESHPSFQDVLRAGRQHDMV